LKKQEDKQFFRRAIIHTANKNNVILGVQSLHATYQIRRVWGRARAIAHHSCPGLVSHKIESLTYCCTLENPPKLCCQIVLCMHH